MDISSAPILADITVDGKPVKAVAQPSKQGFLYVLDRVTGKPVWPIEEKKVELGTVPDEWYSPTQPIPTKPPAYSRNGVLESDLIDFTPELLERGKAIASKYHLGPVFTPPTESKVDGPLGTLTVGTASAAPIGPEDRTIPSRTRFMHLPVMPVRSRLDWCARRKQSQT